MRGGRVGAVDRLMAGRRAGAAKVTIAVGGAACLCYLPTVLAKQLGEYQKARPQCRTGRFQGRLAVAAPR